MKFSQRKIPFTSWLDDLLCPIKLSCNGRPTSWFQEIPEANPIYVWRGLVSTTHRPYTRVWKIPFYVLNGSVSLRHDPSNIHEIGARGLGSRKLRICGGPRLRIRHALWSTRLRSTNTKDATTHFSTRRFQEKMDTHSSYMRYVYELTASSSNWKWTRRIKEERREGE